MSGVSWKVCPINRYGAGYSCPVNRGGQRTTMVRISLRCKRPEVHGGEQVCPGHREIHANRRWPWSDNGRLDGLRLIGKDRTLQGIVSRGRVGEEVCPVNRHERRNTIPEPEPGWQSMSGSSSIQEAGDRQAAASRGTCGGWWRSMSGVSVDRLVPGGASRGRGDESMSGVSVASGLFPRPRR